MRMFGRTGIRAIGSMAVFALSLAGVGLSPARAQRPTATSAKSSEQVVKSITVKQMFAIMRAEGYSVTLSQDNVEWKIDGYTCAMLVAPDAIQFYSGFKGGATLEKVNEWNKKRRFSRTYLDDSGDPCLELDLEITGGVTRARIVDFLKTCRGSFEVWRKEVLD